MGFIKATRPKFDYVPSYSLIHSIIKAQYNLNFTNNLVQKIKRKSLKFDFKLNSFEIDSYSFNQ